MSEEHTRHRILLAAGEAFAETGLTGTTVREICRRADVNTAAVNYHFRDKENLYRESIMFAHSEKVTQFPMPNLPPNATPTDRLYAFVLTMAKRLLGTTEMSWQTSLLFREMFHPTGVCRELVEDFIRPHFQMLKAVIIDLTPRELSPLELHQASFSVIGQVHFYKINRPVTEMLVSTEMLDDLFEPEQIARHITQFTVNAIQQGQVSVPQMTAPRRLS
ncbi:MAG: CerR family C-terminal domain-containing protein [Planctomycetaceae bacterium]|jgi:TetR/AcrR family transcriptional regulator, regulator of cefoperazone and chloramphenicol sensitivity|nr:CerR family C-terminal domain-containing protein [Planctomycetaceae bacterium]MDG2390248.1 CerR family C-terminal domain-containing protein [Planctomycetaceae bacterium]